MPLCRILVLPLLLVLSAACDLPRDPEGTLERVRGGTLRVGVVEDPPWIVEGNGEPRGVEADLVRELARELGARIEWTRAGYADLVEALEQFEIDLVVGGLTATMPGIDRVGTTRTYHTTRTVVGVPPDAPAVQALEGLRIGVGEDDITARIHLESRGAIPVPVQDLSAIRGPVAGPAWKLATLGFRETNIVLGRERHVMAVPPGENGFLVRLDEFLRTRRGAVEELLARSAR